MNLLEKIQKESIDIKKDSFDFSFKSDAMTYKSFLTGFNRSLFDLFNSHTNY